MKAEIKTTTLDQYTRNVALMVWLWVLHILFLLYNHWKKQRVFIYYEKEKAEENRCFYANFRKWVESTYTQDITEEEWGEIVKFKVNLTLKNMGKWIILNFQG